LTDTLRVLHSIVGTTSTSTISSKGQTVIPAEIRKRHALTAHSRLAWIDDGSSIRVIPLPEGPQKYGRGMAKGMRLSEHLLAERAKEKMNEQARRRP
jgi:bifunctional DNA-binding transcriptional regulator/antitoxin component of YhaV-PrlF toxin-antitoxin module